MAGAQGSSRGRNMKMATQIQMATKKMGIILKLAKYLKIAKQFKKLNVSVKKICIIKPFVNKKSLPN